MTVAALFASPAEVEANTPVTRDRAIDVIRIVSLVAVVVGHTIMATSTLRDDVFVLEQPAHRLRGPPTNSAWSASRPNI